MYRHYSRAAHGIDLTLVECTKKAVFDAHVTALGKLSSGSLIVSSVLENFVADGCRGLDAGEVSLFANQQITAHVETLADLLRESPESSVFVVPLLDRKEPGTSIYEKRERKNNFECVCLYLLSLDHFPRLPFIYVLKDFFPKLVLTALVDPNLSIVASQKLPSTNQYPTQFHLTKYVLYSLFRLVY